jgi:hypothetical protein
MPISQPAARYSVRPLQTGTWDAFAELVERNGGVMGGCWCQNNHRDPGLEIPEAKRAAKEARVRAGRAHAALVFDADGLAQGWAQYGSPEELPALTHRRAYEQDPPPPRTGADAHFVHGPVSPIM